MVPVELSAIEEPEARATEYLHYHQFFDIWESLDKVVECQSAHVPGMNREEHATWLSRYRVRTTVGCFR
jgi:nuclear pore complex protein Nup107